MSNNKKYAYSMFTQWGVQPAVRALARAERLSTGEEALLDMWAPSRQDMAGNKV